MSAEFKPPLPPTHPVPSLREFLCAHPRKDSEVLLENAPRVSLTYNARGALFEIGHALRHGSDARDEVLLPAFHCPSGVTPLLEAGLRPVFYRVRPDLTLDFDDLLTKVGPRTRAVLVIHYFGFVFDLANLQALRAQGIAVVEDWSHSFLCLDHAGRPALPAMQGDFQVFSFWKLAPCGVGGGLRQQTEGVGLPAWPRPMPSWQERVVRFKRELEEVLDHSPHHRCRRAFQALEGWRTRSKRSVPELAAPSEPSTPLRGEDRYGFDPQLARAGMPSGVRQRLLGTDFEALVHRRRENYALYAEGLPESDGLQPLHQTLDVSCCPWVFPVRVMHRDRFDRGWRSQGVALHTFGIWLHSALQEADAATRADAELLASELLCLSVHQGLGREDIERGIAVIGAHKEQRGCA